jgi:hypothetical protein
MSQPPLLDAIKVDIAQVFCYNQSIRDSSDVSIGGKAIDDLDEERREPSIEIQAKIKEAT